MNIKKIIRQRLQKFIGYGSSIPWIASAVGTRFLRRTSAEVDPYGAYAGWVYFAIKTIANRVAATRMDVYQLLDKDGNVDRLDDHELYTVLGRPNPIMDGTQFLHLLVIYLRLHGAAPIFKIRQGRRIVGLFPMRPDLLKIKQREDGTVDHYEFTTGKKTETFSVDDVMYIRDPDPRDPIRGYSALNAVALEVDVDAAASLWNKTYMENYGEPASVLETDAQLTNEVFDRLKNMWEERYSGAANAGKVAILEQGLRWRQTSTTPKEGGYSETRKETKAAILNILGIPEGFFAKDTTYANAQVAENAMNKYTIDPMLQLIYSHINYFLVPEIDESVWIDYESPINFDRKQKLDECKSGVNVWLTVNEVREQYNYAPIDGGDVIVPSARVHSGNTGDMDMIDDKSLPITRGKIIGMSRKQREIKRKILARSYNGRKVLDNVVGRIKARRAMDRIHEKSTKPIVVKIEKRKNFAYSEKMLAERKSFLLKTEKYEKEFAREMNNVFDEQEKIIMEEIKNLGIFQEKFLKKSKDTIDKITGHVSDEKIEKVLRKQYRLNLHYGAVAIAALMGKDMKDIMKSAAVVYFLTKKPKEQAQKINKKTITRIEKELILAIENGESEEEASRRVAAVFGEARDYRSDRIARTEVGRSQNFARWHEMQELGARKRVWMAVFRNTRPSHAQADGQIVGINDKFIVGGYECDHPNDDALPAHECVNCQCSVSPVVDTDF